MVGLKIPQWQVRQLIDDMNKNKKVKTSGRLSYNEFQQLCTDLKSKDVALTFKTQLTKKDNLQKLGGMYSIFEFVVTNFYPLTNYRHYLN